MTRSALAAIVLAVSMIGCGDGGPKLVPVGGVVTLSGKPLEGAFVRFDPLPVNKEGLPGEDTTGPEGNYKAMTKGRSGLVPGKYHVVVIKLLKAASKDDPFMDQLTAEVPDVGKNAKQKNAAEQIEAQFDREVHSTGGTLDFDITGKRQSQLKVGVARRKARYGEELGRVQSHAQRNEERRGRSDAR
jgi:hypothetical protein